MSRFDFVTSGESHGPGLTTIVEGMPAGLELDREALDRDMARRQLGHGRGGRMKIETDSAEVRSGVRHGRTHGQPDHAARRQSRLRELGRAHGALGERRGRQAGPPAATRPRRPSRTAEVRLRGRAQRARARQRPRDGRPRRRRRPGAPVPRGARRDDPQPRDADRRRRGARSRHARGVRLRRRRRRSRALPRPRVVGGDGRGDQPAPQGEREPRRHLRGPRLGSRAGPRLARLLGREAGRADRAGDGLDPVGQGRQHRPGLGGRRRAPARRPTTRSSTRPSAASTARPIAPAASRAA